VNDDFEDFYATNARTLYRAMYVMTGHRADAEDVTQEAFVRVLQKWPHVQTMDSPAGYLYQVAFNQCKRRFRRAHRAAMPGVEDGADPIEAVESRILMVAALRRLTFEQREALVLVDLVGLTSDEAARQLGVAPESVRGRIHRARQALRGALEREAHDRD